jgi:hypothetical protein
VDKWLNVFKPTDNLHVLYLYDSPTSKLRFDKPEISSGADSRRR